MALRLARAAVLATLTTVKGDHLADDVGLVQKALLVSNHTAASGLLVKLSGLLHMIDHDLNNDGSRSDVLESLFECTRNAGVGTADKIIGLTNGIISLRGNCAEQANGGSRRNCAKDVTGFLADTLGLIMTLPTLPETCFGQDCSAPNNFATKMAPVVAAGAGVETILATMTAIGNIDETCIDKNSASISAADDGNLQYPTWLYWVLKPFSLLNAAYDTGVLASSVKDEEYRYGICADIAGFTGEALSLMGALFDVKGHMEGGGKNTRRSSKQSAQWACASSITGLLSALPGTIAIACSYDSCKGHEPIQDAKASSWGGR
mmetsp:Transcript_10392/g.32874  ORF Transcript_10392/g.32874 Transcript_10392/m.32874 type:complete len:320 (+) Transcript_10392:85-1044(+)